MDMSDRALAAAQAVLSAAATAGAATLLALGAQGNPVTAGFIYLLSVLVLTVWGGFLVGAIGSILATACFNYFFFPPVGTFHIADPQNWVALCCFLVGSMIASRLVARERERASEAQCRQREIEALYNLCVELFTAGSVAGGLDAATGRALATIGAQGGGLILRPGGMDAPGGDVWVGMPKDLEMHRLLMSAAEPSIEGAKNAWRNVRIPVAAGGHCFGDLVAYGTRARRETLESVARLIALALERERWIAERTRLEALRQSDSLKTTLLQAVSHDLSTPLTAVLVSIQSLRRELADDPGTRDTIELIATETSRLHRRIQNLLELARLQAGSARPSPEPTPPGDLFRSARESLADVASRQRIRARVEDGCPDLDVDPSLTLEIIANLIENALRASPPALSIELVARRRPDDPERVLVEVLDRGAGLPPSRHSHAVPSLDASAGDMPRKGLGLEIARSFTAALNGRLRLLPRDGGGVRAEIDLPATRLAGASSHASFDGF